MKSSANTISHAPICVKLALIRQNFSTCKHSSPSFNFLKADWASFASQLDSISSSDLLTNIDVFNSFLTFQIIEAANANIPITTQKFSKRLPKDLLALVKERRRIRRKLGVHPDLKPEYNRLTRELKQRVISHNSETWDAFLKGLGPGMASSRPFWRKINETRTNNTTKQLPTLKHNNATYASESSKANLFADLLEDTFRGPTSASFDQNHKTSIEQKTESRLFCAKTGG